MDEIGQEVFKRQTGSAPTFQSIDGVGPKTAEKVKGTIVEGTGRIQAPQDVSDLTDDQLADKAGISKTRARKVIKGAGGNPDREPRRRSTGSVSAAGIKLPQGEFVTEVSDQDKAEAKFSTSRNRGIGRSQNAAIADKNKRAPVTTDFERWKDNKGELDFPGVDTPTESPDVRPKDLRQEQRPNTTDPKQSAAARATVPDAPSTERNTAAPLPFTTDLGQRDVSLAPEEAFEGVGSSGMASESREDVPITDRFARFDADARDEARELDEIAAQGPQPPDNANNGRGLNQLDEQALDAGVAVAGFASDQFDPTDEDTPNAMGLGIRAQGPLSAAKVTDDDPDLGDETVGTLRETVDYLESEYEGDPREELPGFDEFSSAVRQEAKSRGDR